MMKNFYRFFLAASLANAAAGMSQASVPVGNIATSNCFVSKNGDNVEVTVDFILDSLHLSSNRQIYITPVITDGNGNRTGLPSVLVNGKNMQLALERKVIKATDARHPEVAACVRRKNGKSQTVGYHSSVPLQSWMLAKGACVSFPLDTCGCGVAEGSGEMPGSIPLTLNPADEMIRTYITPKVMELPVSIHEGRARVQFEVDRTELHPDPYRCKNGQNIDNRAELKVIDDSIRYALTDPNVEIAEINICGYASPESPYGHNEELATGRSRSLAEYIADRYSLPREKCHYTSVPENWEEFRTMVLESTELTPIQREDLLELIDRPARTPEDYDEKERLLKTDPRYEKLYKKNILPYWFPKLRATKFEIKTRLRPMSDEKLAEIILLTPEMMSLNQMFRVANLYEEGSDNFNRAIEIALDKNPDDETANLNAAVTALNNRKLDDAERLLKKAGDSPEAENARGILETYHGNFDEARRHFEKALPLHDASRNLKLLR